MKQKIHIWIVLTIFAVVQSEAAQHTVDLSGTWSFQLDENDIGLQEKWFEKDLRDAILLPGSTDERGFGTNAREPERTRLTREHRYLGPAWYQRSIEIPEREAGDHIELVLERVMWESRVWLDDHSIGTADSLCVPHRFDLSDYATAGSHRLTVRIDNRLKINVGHESGGWTRMWAMCLTDESQTTWNGVVGRIELKVRPPVWIERIETFSELNKKYTLVHAFIRSRIGAVQGNLTVSAACREHTMGPVTSRFQTKAPGDRAAHDPFSSPLKELTGPFYARHAVTRVELLLPFGEDAELWDEFSPSVYRLKAQLTAQSAGRTYIDTYTDTFGLRSLSVEGRRFTLNGRTIFLRGNQDNCVHPKTGYPPMDKTSWRAFLQKHKDYGLNTMRFHSWCPPEAAFEAADELGMFVHVECPLWEGTGNVGLLPARAAFIRNEAERILTEYGNHPSFCFWSAGNELGSGTEYYLKYLVEVLRQRDRRHLYTCTSHPARTGGNDDFLVGASGSGPARGLEHMGGLPFADYSRALEIFSRPFVSHEIGQWTSFPDFYSWFNEAKYTGPLKARYISALKKQFETHHPPERGPVFARASGALQLLLYKAEIEAMLRTPAMSGFHLNGLMDYPGEGIALIGMLDALGESKGIAAPEAVRCFCSPIVPLVRMQKQAYQAGEVFEARAEVRHHGPVDLIDSHWNWRLVDRAGRTHREGSFGKCNVPTGGLASLGTIKTKLPGLEKACELTLELWLEKGIIRNWWRIWVYPAIDSLKVPNGVLVTDSWNDAARKALAAGGRVLLLPPKEYARESVPIRFYTVFWGRGLFPHLPRPMGLSCDPTHPALAAFPTRNHSDWHWYDLVTDAYAVTINPLPFAYKPVVSVIDDFNLSHRLGAILEASVGDGRLLVCTLNLGRDGSRTLPQKQMLKSLLERTGGDDFTPKQSLTLKQIDRLFETSMTAWQEHRLDRPRSTNEPFFLEQFTGLKGGGSGTQLDTNRPLKHSAHLPGWKAEGFNAIHAVMRTDGTWAIQVLAAENGHNSLTLITGIPANQKGENYTVRFQAGPSVYEIPDQATQAGDRFTIELLRSDGSVLKKDIVAPGGWTGKEHFTACSFSYIGDGSGDLRLRISPVPAGGTRFVGAISHIEVLESRGKGKKQ